MSACYPIFVRSYGATENINKHFLWPDNLYGSLSIAWSLLVAYDLNHWVVMSKYVITDIQGRFKTTT